MCESMIIQFPSSYPLKELWQMEIPEIEKNGFPYFDSRWFKEKDTTLGTLCINVILNNPSKFTPEMLKKLPTELIEKIKARGLEKHVREAVANLPLWLNVPDNLLQGKNVFHFINEFVFNGLILALPVLDVNKKKIEVGHGEYSFDITEADFGVKNSILRIMRGGACVGVSFLLELSNGLKTPWTIMQGFNDHPNIWCPFQKEALICHPSMLFNIQDLVLAKKRVEEVIDRVYVMSPLWTSPLVLLDFWKTQDPIHLFIWSFRQLLSGQSISVIESLTVMKLGKMPQILNATLAKPIEA
jgi:hypothetical protein